VHLEQAFRNYIFNELVSGKNPKKVDDDDELIDSGILDSLAIVQLITHLEEAHQIEVEPGEVVVENFGSIRRLADFVRRKVEVNNSSPGLGIGLKSLK
jgi:acyl carrier protein